MKESGEYIPTWSGEVGEFCFLTWF